MTNRNEIDERVIPIEVIKGRLKVLDRECEAAMRRQPCTLQPAQTFEPFPFLPPENGIDKEEARQQYRESRIYICHRLRDTFAWWYAQCDYHVNRPVKDAFDPYHIIQTAAERDALVPNRHIRPFCWFTWLYLPAFFYQQK